VLRSFTLVACIPVFARNTVTLAFHAHLLFLVKIFSLQTLYTFIFLIQSDPHLITTLQTSLLIRTLLTKLLTILTLILLFTIKRSNSTLIFTSLSYLNHLYRTVTPPIPTLNKRLIHTLTTLTICITVIAILTTRGPRFSI